MNNVICAWCGEDIPKGPCLKHFSYRFHDNSICGPAYAHENGVDENELQRYEVVFDGTEKEE